MVNFEEAAWKIEYSTVVDEPDHEQLASDAVFVDRFLNDLDAPWTHLGRRRRAQEDGEPDRAMRQHYYHGIKWDARTTVYPSEKSCQRRESTSSIIENILSPRKEAIPSTTAAEMQQWFPQEPKPTKTAKRGLSGYVNGLKVEALPDTGASQNTMSLQYAQENNIQVVPSQSDFALGNRKIIQTVGESMSLLLQLCVVGPKFNAAKALPR